MSKIQTQTACLLALLLLSACGKAPDASSTVTPQVSPTPQAATAVEVSVCQVDFCIFQGGVYTTDCKSPVADGSYTVGWGTSCNYTVLDGTVKQEN